MPFHRLTVAVIVGLAVSVSPARAQNTRADVLRIIMDTVQETGTSIVGVGSWVTGQNYRDPLIILQDASDHDMRLVMTDATEAEALTRWRRVRAAVIERVKNTFGPRAGNVLRSINIYPPDVITSGFTDPDDVLRYLQLLDACPNLGTGPTEGLWNAKAFRDFYERRAGLTIWPETAMVQGKAVRVARTGYADLLPLGEAAGTYTVESTSGMARQLTGKIDLALRNGDASTVRKQVARLRDSLKKARDLARIAPDNYLDDLVKQLTAHGDDLATLALDLSDPRTASRVSSLVARAEMDAAMLRVYATSTNPRDLVVFKELLEQGTGRWARVRNALIEAAGHVPWDPLLKGLVVCLAYIQVRDLAALSAAGKGEALLQEALVTAGFTASVPLGVLTLMSKAIAADARDAGYGLVASYQDCDDLIAGIYEVKGREWVPAQLARERTIEQLAREHTEEAPVLEVVAKHARAAAARDLGAAGTRVDPEIEESLRKRCGPRVVELWQRQRAAWLADAVEQAAAIERTVSEAPLVASASPAMLWLTAAKPVEFTAAAVLQLDTDDLTRRVRALETALKALGGTGHEVAPAISFNYTWVLDGSDPTDENVALSTISSAFDPKLAARRFSLAAPGAHRVEFEYQLRIDLNTIVDDVNKVRHLLVKVIDRTATLPVNAAMPGGELAIGGPAYPVFGQPVMYEARLDPNLRLVENLRLEWHDSGRAGPPPEGMAYQFIPKSRGPRTLRLEAWAEIGGRMTKLATAAANLTVESKPRPDANPPPGGTSGTDPSQEEIKRHIGDLLSAIIRQFETRQACFARVVRIGTPVLFRQALEPATVLHRPAEPPRVVVTGVFRDDGEFPWLQVPTYRELRIPFDLLTGRPTPEQEVSLYHEAIHLIEDRHGVLLDNSKKPRSERNTEHYMEIVLGALQTWEQYEYAVLNNGSLSADLSAALGELQTDLGRIHPKAPPDPELGVWAGIDVSFDRILRLYRSGDCDKPGQLTKLQDAAEAFVWKRAFPVERTVEPDPSKPPVDPAKPRPDPGKPPVDPPKPPGEPAKPRTDPVKPPVPPVTPPVTPAPTPPPAQGRWALTEARLDTANSHAHDSECLLGTIRMSGQSSMHMRMENKGACWWARAGGFQTWALNWTTPTGSLVPGSTVKTTMSGSIDFNAGEPGDSVNYVGASMSVVAGDPSRLGVPWQVGGLEMPGGPKATYASKTGTSAFEWKVPGGEKGHRLRIKVDSGLWQVSMHYEYWYDYVGAGEPTPPGLLPTESEAERAERERREAAERDKTKRISVTARITAGGARVRLGDTVSFAASASAADGSALPAGLVYRWQPHPEVAFEPFEPSASTSASFRRLGRFRVWVQVLQPEGDTLATAAESDQIEIEVVPPEISLSVSPSVLLPGQLVRVTASETPRVGDDLITYWWEHQGNVTSPGVQADPRVFWFKLKDTAPVTVIAHAKGREAGEDLGTRQVVLAATSHTISVSPPIPRGPKPRIWDPVHGGLTEVETQLAVFQDFSVRATVAPAVVNPPARFAWVVAPEGCTVSNPISQEPTFNCRQTGTYTATVTVRDRDDALLGRGSGQFSITISQADLDRSERQRREAETAPATPALVIEALIDGTSELHITTKGLYWKHLAWSKPGRNGGKNEPTRVNGKPWLPVWRSPASDAAEQSAVYAIDIGSIDFKVGPDPKNRNPVRTARVANELIVYFDDPQPWDSWYVVRLKR